MALTHSQTAFAWSLGLQTCSPSNIEKEIYGWFWECPNGEKCIYCHALPPGFVFKKIGKQVLEEEEKITIEELVEK